jgi:aminopeptidase N
MKTIVIFTYLVLCSALLEGQAGFEKYKPLPAGNSAYLPGDKSEPIYNSLMDNYDVTFYKLDLAADNNSIHLSGNVTILATVVSASLDTFVMELNPDYTVDSIRINSSRPPFLFHDDDLKVPVHSGLPNGASIDAVVYYHGSLSGTSQGFFSGISHDSNRQITYTLSEPLYAKDWFPCKQVLTDKADSVYVFITTDSTLKAGSNGLLTKTVALGNGKVRYEWKSKYPIDYYLISMTIGNYVEYDIYAHPEGTTDSILIQNYIYDSLYLNYYKPVIDQTPAILEAYCNMFGMYPFRDEKYGHCMAPIGGGMEHQTMTTLSAFDFELVAHELAHMWFGDYVTCGTWNDIWINEGFATYCHLLVLEYINGSFPTATMVGYINDQIVSVPDGSTYIPQEYFNIDYSNCTLVDNLSNRIFDWGLSYEKGAIILHMLRYELQDDEMFFNILRSYLSQYQFGNAIGTDFKDVVKEISGIDFTGFFNQWYFGEGYPRYRITWYQENDTVFVHSRQGKSTPNAPFFRMHIDYELSYSGGYHRVRVEQTVADQVFKIPMTESALSLTFDPDHWLLAEVDNISNDYFSALPSTTGPDKTVVYPNPFTERLTFDLSKAEVPVRIQIYNSMGICLYNESIEKQSISIVTEKYPPGIYFIILENEKETRVEKLVKN